MNKTLKRVLASMLAILMIICSMPFTVYATEVNRKWWIDDGIDPASITAEPEFWGYNSPEDPVHQPYGPWEMQFGEKLDFIDVPDYEDHRDDYKPFFAITVSDVGSSGEDIATILTKYQNNYSSTSARTFDAAMSDGTIINPAQLKAGQRIAVTFEEGGFDVINTTQLLGSYDPEYIQPGYYAGTPSTRLGDRWTLADGTSAWKTSNALYAAKGDAVAYAGASAANGRFTFVVNGAAFTNGERLCSNYIGRNAEERGFDSPYGLVMGTLFLEVKQDCDLKDVLILSGRPDGCIIEPVCRDVWGDGLYNGTIDEFEHAFVNMPVVWTAYSAGDEPVVCEHVNTTTTTDITVAATCTTAGTEVVTVTCDDCGEVLSTVENEIPAIGHDYTGALTPAGSTQHTVACVNGCGTTETVDCTFTVVDHKDATVTEEGYDKYECACGNAYTVTIEKLVCEHANTTTTTEVTKAATCTETGTEVVTVTCNDCGAVVSTTTNTLDKLPHTEKVVAGTPATCTATGLTDGKVCEVCGEVLVEQTVIDMLPHTEKVVAGTPATCTATGLTDGKVCEVCGEVLVEQTVIEAIGHDYQVVEGSAVAPTIDAAGKEADLKCANCGDVITGAPIAMLPSYNITVTGTDLGSVTLNGIDVTDGATVKVAAGSTVTLTAEHNDGVEFLGWHANGLTTVSTDTTFTPVALADVTYTPVFAKADDTAFTVTFADGYGNIVKSQVVADASEIVIPDAPARSGYVFVGWTLSDEEIAALTSSATIIAMYELAESEGFTVTAAGATITAEGIDAADVATGVAYDTLVTVTKEGAKAWSVNGVTVAYGDTYSFYVGSDIEVVAIMDGVEAVPMVGNVGYVESGAAGAIKVQFLATRTMVDGYTYIDSGFVYGKGDLGEITLDDVNGSAVKAAYTMTASEQFSLSYGLAAQSGSMTARAFLAYAKADGEVVVVYAAPMIYTYA